MNKKSENTFFIQIIILVIIGVVTVSCQVTADFKGNGTGDTSLEITKPTPKNNCGVSFQGSDSFADIASKSYQLKICGWSEEEIIVTLNNGGDS